MSAILCSLCGQELPFGRRSQTHGRRKSPLHKIECNRENQNGHISFSPLSADFLTRSTGKMVRSQSQNITSTDYMREARRGKQYVWIYQAVAAGGVVSSGKGEVSSGRGLAW